MNTGQTRWYSKINPKATHLIALDPSLGTGGDYAAIQVFEMPAMKQVGEWRHNLTPVQQQVRVLQDILKYITNEQTAAGNSNPTVYYSVENNTLGEAALVTISDIGEENFQGLFLSEPIRKGHVRRYRKGFNTTHKTKITACSLFKNALEKDKLSISSKPLISELKTFVATGVSYNAKTGEHDDLVSAVLLIMRMADQLANWDPKIYEKMTERMTDDEYPLPIFVSGGF